MSGETANPTEGRETPFYGDLGAGPEWGTPPTIVRTLVEALGELEDADARLFDLDPASGAEPFPYARTRWTKADDGLARDWFGHVWLNPPYGRRINDVWAGWAYHQVVSGNVDSLTALVANSSSTDWFDLYARAPVRCDLDQRLKFYDPSDDGEEMSRDSASFASTIVVFGIENLHDGYLDALEELGTLWFKEQDPRTSDGGGTEG